MLDEKKLEYWRDIFKDYQIIKLNGEKYEFVSQPPSYSYRTFLRVDGKALFIWGDTGWHMFSYGHDNFFDYLKNAVISPDYFWEKCMSHKPAYDEEDTVNEAVTFFMEIENWIEYVDIENLVDKMLPDDFINDTKGEAVYDELYAEYDSRIDELGKGGETNWDSLEFYFDREEQMKVGMVYFRKIIFENFARSFADSRKTIYGRKRDKSWGDISNPNRGKIYKDNIPSLWSKWYDFSSDDYADVDAVVEYLMEKYDTIKGAIQDLFEFHNEYIAYDAITRMGFDSESIVYNWKGAGIETFQYILYIIVEMIFKLEKIDLYNSIPVKNKN